MKGSRAGLKSFFEPRSIAVAGVSADPDKLGSIIFQNLLENRESGILKSSVYAMNPAHPSVGGSRAYPSVDALPEVPELLIVAVPESQTEDLVESAANAGVKAVIIIAGGYAETGKGEAERRIARAAARTGMRVIGPNTIGVVDTRSGVDSLFLRPTKRLADGRVVSSLLRPLRGGITVVTQSGHLGEAVVEELAANGVGIRALVGTGNQVDVSVEDVVEYFEGDPQTKAIALYVEGVRDGRKFIEVSHRASGMKPIVALKVGKTGSGARAALTHTASLVGDYDVYRAAFRQAGVVEARGFQELVDFSIVLSMVRAKGDRLAIITNAGGVGALAADEAQASGLRVEPLAPGEIIRLRSEFRDSGFIVNASLGNPVDLTASAKTDEFCKVVEEVAGLPQYDLVLVLPTHQTPAIDPDIADRLAEVAVRVRKPVCMCVVGRAELAEELHGRFIAQGVPSFPTPERAVRALAAAWSYSRKGRMGPLPSEVPVKQRRRVWKAGQLSHAQATALLLRYGVAGPKSEIVREDRDLRKLGSLGFPIACKLLSRGIPHKVDVGGVVLDVKTAAEARDTFVRLRKIAQRKRAVFEGMLAQEMVGEGVEMVLGGKRDNTFGPVVTAGLGGSYVELSREVSLAVAPITPSGARSMLEGTRLELILRGYRGGPGASLKRIYETIARFSRAIAENPSLAEVEVNPLIVNGDSVVAVDVRASASDRADRDSP